MRAALVSIVSLALLAACSGGATPSADDSRAYLEDQVRAKVDPDAHVVDFKKS